MDQEFQFGDLAEAEPQTGLRPDQNRHYAVVPVETPAEQDMPVYVDFDALQDMESHAQSDTSVELGGVLLGRQYRDAQGQPFVVITDSLRARHYQATKGSFKFTHDTWERISRERDEFPPDVQMVGWYHTHPDWGVFLSGMDMFICDNFFNRPQDVALVIDPCRHDRGFFQWTGDDAQRVRRTSGFYLIASRFRRAELEEYAAWLEGVNEMASNPRFPAAQRGQFAAPVVQLAYPSSTWQQAGMWGALALQFCLLLVVAWRLSDQAAAAGRPQPAISGGATATSGDAADAVLDAKLEVLDLVISRIDGAPERLATQLAERTGEVVALREDLRAHRGLTTRLETELDEARAALATTRRRTEQLLEERDALEGEASRLAEQLDTETSWTHWHWSWLALAAAAGAVLGGGLVAGLTTHRSEEAEGFLDDDADTAPGARDLE